MTSLFFDRHVLDGLAGQKFESTWGEGKLSNRARLVGPNSRALPRRTPFGFAQGRLRITKENPTKSFVILRALRGPSLPQEGKHGILQVKVFQAQLQAERT